MAWNIALAVVQTLLVLWLALRGNRCLEDEDYPNGLGLIALSIAINCYWLLGK